MTNTLSFSIILPTYNRKETLLKCVRSLEKQSYDHTLFEILIVDDGSTDDTEQLVLEYSKTSSLTIQYIRQENSGPGKARNNGLQHAKHSIIGFIEDDVIASPDWITNVSSYFMDESISGVEGKTILQNTDSDVRVFETPGQLGFLPCNMFLRKSVVEKIGGFSSEYFDAEKKMYFREDADYGFRMLNHNFKVVFAANVIVSHPELYRSPGDYFRHARRYYFDPLLYKRYPKYYRRLIEIKRIGTITVHRPFHYTCKLHVISSVVFLISLIVSNIALTIPSIAVLSLTITSLRIRYERTRWKQYWNFSTTLSLFVLPFYYCFWLIRGCLHFKSWGSLL